MHMIFGQISPDCFAKLDTCPIGSGQPPGITLLEVKIGMTSENVWLLHASASNLKEDPLAVHLALYGLDVGEAFKTNPKGDTTVSPLRNSDIAKPVSSHIA